MNNCFVSLGTVTQRILKDIALSRVGACDKAFEDHDERKMARPSHCGQAEPVRPREREETRTGWERDAASRWRTQGTAGRDRCAWKPGSLAGSRSPRGITLNEALPRGSAVFEIEFRPRRESRGTDRRRGVGAPQPSSAPPLRL